MLTQPTEAPPPSGVSLSRKRSEGKEREKVSEEEISLLSVFAFYCLLQGSIANQCTTTTTTATTITAVLCFVVPFNLLNFHPFLVVKNENQKGLLRFSGFWLPS